jgi:hypothetical protein
MHVERLQCGARRMNDSGELVVRARPTMRPVSCCDATDETRVKSQRTYAGRTSARRGEGWWREARF